MRMPLQPMNAQPVPLRSNVIFFHDWRYVNHGSPGWRAADESAVEVFRAGEVPAVRVHRGEIPVGVRLRAMPAQRSEPFLWPEMPWEGMIGYPTALQLPGERLVRVWYECVPPQAMGGAHAGSAHLLCDAEGTGAGKWYRPLRPDCPYGAAAETNIVYGGDRAGPWGYRGGSVFLDPAAPEAERFKVIYLARAPVAELADFIAAHPESVSPWPPRAERAWVVAGAVSPDGRRWTRRPAPLLVHFSDT